MLFTQFGPIIYDVVTEDKEKELSYCYINSLELAVKSGIRTIAFPCISTGEFRFPKETACKIAIKTVNRFLLENEGIDKVVFNVYGEEDYRIYEKQIREN